MSGYTKLFGSILDSTIWQEDKDTKILWITMLAMKNGQQVVEAAVPGLAKRAGLTVEECSVALEKLKAPDPYSRTKEFEGRRIQEVPGGWLILNGEKYRERLDRKEYQRIKQAEYRAKRKSRAQRDGSEREARFVEAYKNGDDGKCDQIAAEGIAPPKPEERWP